MNKRVRELLIRFETNEKIPHVMRGILRNTRIDREERCKACGGLRTSYTQTELALLDPNNAYPWNWCTCDPDAIRWVEISHDAYWDIYRANEQYYGDLWTSFGMKRWDKGYYNVYGAKEHVVGGNVTRKARTILKVEKDGNKYKYFRVNENGWV
jgi:hypothetical protein